MNKLNLEFIENLINSKRIDTKQIKQTIYLIDNCSFDYSVDNMEFFSYFT